MRREGGRSIASSSNQGRATRLRSEMGRSTPTLVCEGRPGITAKSVGEAGLATPCSAYETAYGLAPCKVVGYATSSMDVHLETKAQRPTRARERRRERDARRPLV